MIDHWKEFAEDEQEDDSVCRNGNASDVSRCPAFNGLLLLSPEKVDIREFAIDRSYSKATIDGVTETGTTTVILNHFRVGFSYRLSVAGTTGEP